MTTLSRLMRLAVMSVVIAFAVMRPAPAQDDPRAVPLFNAQHPLVTILTTAKSNDKAIVVMLRSGASYTGKVKDVGAEGVILTGLAGKEFFDAWVRLESIVAMEERVRMR